MQKSFRSRLLVTALACASPLALGCVGSIGDGKPAAGGQTPAGVPGAPDKQKPGAGPGGAPVAPDAPRTCSADQVGPTPLHRLTRLEYDNSIRDLIGEDLKLARTFTEDERAGTFTANSFTPITEMQFTQYATGAAAAADRAVALLPKLLPCDPAPDPAACATQFIKQFGRRAFRRPLDDAEVARYQKVFEVGRTGVDFANGVHLVVEAMLESPKFLYLIEGPGPLTQHQMASRLSYFLWDAPPDAQLSAAADSGALGTIAGLRAQAKRLIADPRAQDMIADFHFQWLGLERLPKLQKDAALYADFEGLRPAIMEETGRFVAEVMKSEGGRLESLLAAPYSVVSGPLAALYGLPAGGADWRKVSLDPKQRAGLLTQAAFLTANGAFDGSSPIRRGLAVRERVLCADMPVPPPNVDQNIPPLMPGDTTRQRFDRHRSDPSCSSCHELMDKLGYAFESYDGIGRYRTMERGQPVDDSGAIVGTDVDGPVKGAAELAHRLAQSKQVQTCVATQWFRYAFGRLQTEVDKCVLDSLMKTFTGSDLRVADLLMAIVESEAFRSYRRLN
jgi:hypothetical protein